MSKRSSRGVLCVLGAALLCASALPVAAELGAGVATAPLGRQPERARVLLLGNSYTRFNVMPRMLRMVAQGAGAPLHIDAVARAGYTLRRHWRAPETRERLRSGRYTHVVLQGHSLRPVDRPDEFAEYAQRFARAVRDAGAEPILYETWPRHPSARFYREHGLLHSAPEMALQVGDAYRRLAREHGARVAPVGRAFLSGLSALPELALYKPDGAHPTPHGSYLAACVIFGAITGADPRTTSYVPWELRDGGAEALRELAAATLASE